jgi:hypothetical protein
MRSSNCIFPPLAFLEFSQIIVEYAIADGKKRKRCDGERVWVSKDSLPAQKNFLLKVFFLAMLNIV